MDAVRKKQYRLEHWHMIALYLMIYDAIVVNCSYFFVLWLRFDKSKWRFADCSELLQVFTSSVITSVFYAASSPPYYGEILCYSL